MTLVIILAFCGYFSLAIWFITRPTVYSSEWPFGNQRDLLRRRFTLRALYDCYDQGLETVVEVKYRPRIPWAREESYRLVKRHDLGMWFWDTGTHLSIAPEHVWDALEACVSKSDRVERAVQA